VRVTSDGREKDGQHGQENIGATHGSKGECALSLVKMWGLDQGSKWRERSVSLSSGVDVRKMGLDEFHILQMPRRQPMIRWRWSHDPWSMDRLLEHPIYTSA